MVYAGKLQHVTFMNDNIVNAVWDCSNNCNYATVVAYRLKTHFTTTCTSRLVLQ